MILLVKRSPLTTAGLQKILNTIQSLLNCGSSRQKAMIIIAHCESKLVKLTPLCGVGQPDLKWIQLGSPTSQSRVNFTNLLSQ